jgi:hypothetical protein
MSNYERAKQAIAELNEWLADPNCCEGMDRDEAIQLLTRIRDDKSLYENAVAIRMRALREFGKLAEELGIDPEMELLNLNSTFKRRF